MVGRHGPDEWSPEPGGNDNGAAAAVAVAAEVDGLNPAEKIRPAAFRLRSPFVLPGLDYLPFLTGNPARSQRDMPPLKLRTV
jgi:hypothetical protein